MIASYASYASRGVRDPATNSARMRARRFFCMDCRTALAFVVSPIAGPALVHLPELVLSSPSNPGLFAAMTLIVAAVCLCCNVAVAVPFYLILRRYGEPGFVSCIAGGALVGVLIPFGLTGSFSNNLWMASVIYGVTIAGVFWLAGVAWPRSRRDATSRS